MLNVGDAESDGKDFTMMEEDATDTRNMHERFDDDGELVRVPGEEVDEKQMQKAVSKMSTRRTSFNIMISMVYRLVSVPY